MTRVTDPGRESAEAASGGHSVAPLFRPEALSHHLESHEGRELVRIAPPWTWALVGVTVSIAGAALLLSIVGEVELHTRGRGIVRPRPGIRVPSSQVAGVVEHVDVRAGDRVTRGAVLVRLDAASIRGQAFEARSHVASG